MNRRSFFKSLAFLTGGVAAAPTIFVPKLIEAVKWKSLNRWEPLGYSAYEIVLPPKISCELGDLISSGAITEPLTGLTFNNCLWSNGTITAEIVNGSHPDGELFCSQIANGPQCPLKRILA
jgi:hypothetical protein